MVSNFELPNGEIVSFNSDGHVYTVSGKTVPSITELIKRKYGDAYSRVNPELLQRSADYGTAVHSELERLINLRAKNPDALLDSPYQEVTNYFTYVEEIYKIHPLATEKVVVLYDENGDPCAAGRFDLVCKVEDDLVLADFKTTSSIHRQSVVAQLNLYLKAAKQSGYFSTDDKISLGVIHLSGFTSKYVPIPVLDENFYLHFIK